VPGGRRGQPGHTLDEALANLAEAVELYLDEVDDPAGYITATPSGDLLPAARRVSPALDALPVRKVIRALESAGFSHVRTKGSHAVYRDPEGRVAIIPQHGVVKRGTPASILRQVGLTAAEFLELLD
jgi:predicted RNA binding protein YcfA (HicA-like mRNA interferase family)